MRVQNSVSPGGDAIIDVALVGMTLPLVSRSKIYLAFFKIFKHGPNSNLKK